MFIRHAWGLLFVVMLAGCVSFKPIAYTAQPTRIQDPQEEVKALVLSNTISGCVTQPAFSGKTFSVRFVCPQSIGNTFVRLDHVQSVNLEQSGEWYACRVKHSGGERDFIWTSRSVDDMQHLVDAFTALSGTAPVQPVNTTTEL